MSERNEKIIIKHGDEVTRNARVESKIFIMLREIYSRGFPYETVIHIKQSDFEEFDGETAIYLTVKQII